MLLSLPIGLAPTVQPIAQPGPSLYDSPGSSEAAQDLPRLSCAFGAAVEGVVRSPRRALASRPLLPRASSHTTPMREEGTAPE